MSVSTLDNQLCFALYLASNHLTNIYRPLLDPLDLTYTQFIVLMALWQKDNVSISYLAEKLGLSKATMTPLLKRLEQKGFVLREVPPDNERQKNIILTERGCSLSKQSAEITGQVFCTTGLTESEADEIISLCKKIIK